MTVLVVLMAMGGLALMTIGGLMVLALCRAAKRGDEMMEGHGRR